MRFALRGGAMVLAAALIIGGAGLPSSAAAPGVVQRVGAGLAVDGKPLRLVGANNYRLTSMRGGYECGGVVSDAELAQILDLVKASGANALRTWFFQSYARSGTADRWAAFDRVLDAAAARGLKVIPVLVNHWSACDASPTKTTAFYAGGYRQPETPGRQSYRAYAADVAARYAGSPTVAFWQLVNEPETPGACGHSGAQVLRAFGDDMTATVKAADPQHLVSLGTIGSGQCGAQGSDYSYVHAGAVDLCEYHDYGAPGAAVPGDKYNGLQVRINQCNALGKPLVVGEAGIARDVAPGGGRTGSVTPATLQARAAFFNRKITGQLAAGVDGFLIWSVGQASTDGFDVLAGDPTLAVLRGRAPVTAPPLTAPPSTAPAPSGGKPARFGFESPGALTGGWEVAWGAGQLALSSTDRVAAEGRRSLALNLRGRGYPAARVRSGLTGLAAGTRVTYRVHAPVAGRIEAVPYVSDSGWRQHFGRPVALQAGWNTVSFTVPRVGVEARASRPDVAALGLQLNNASGWTGTVALDAVTW